MNSLLSETSVSDLLQEAIKGIYTMDGLSYYELKKMVEFFYSGEYTPSMEPEDFKRAGTIFNYYTLHVKLYLLGDRFDCENLRAYALAQYKSYWGTFSEDDGCGYIFEHFRWLYGESETDSTFFRRFACSSWRKTFHHHLDEEEYNSRYNDLLRDLPEFAVDLLNGWEKVAALERKVEKDSSMSD